MPIYEYRRDDGSTFEVMQSFSDDALTHDPETGGAVQRVLHAPAVHFKGKGFYNTDYGTRNRQRETAAAAENGSKSEGSKDGGSSKDGASKEKSSTEGSSTAPTSKSSSSGGGSDGGSSSGNGGSPSSKPDAAKAKSAK
jgi:putative FmdB family regulatory protein